MKSRSLAWAACCAFVVLIAFPPARAAFGQKEKGKRVNLTGTIEGIRPGLMKVKVKDDEEWLVQFAPNIKNTRLVGSAEPAWLRPGMLVHFRARFDAKGKALAPVSQVTVFTPSREKDYKVGLVSAANPAADISFSGEKRKQPSAELGMPFDVTGQLRAVQRGRMLVAAGRVTVQVELDEKANISVDIADYRGARVGDKVSFQGQEVAPGKAIAQSFRITAAERFGAAAKKPSAEGATPEAVEPEGAKPKEKKVESDN